MTSCEHDLEISSKTMIEQVIKQIPSPGLTEKQLLDLEAAMNSGEFPSYL